MSDIVSGSNWNEIRFTANDGLTLSARHYPAREAGRRPLLCLAGLTRNARDFHSLASAFANHPDTPRDVYCLDTRGRGMSDYDPNWQNYAPFIELIDTLDFMTLTGLHRAAVLGTSRGGIIAMLMAAVRPGAIGVAILNDIGPEIDKTGLARIRGYVGRTPLPLDWDEAVRIVRGMNEHLFPKLKEEDWRELAHQWFFEDEDGMPAPAYDEKLASTLETIDLTKDVPPMWPQFLALGRVPLMLLRGEHSDILTEKTALEMTKRHARMEYVVVKNEGHAPLLRDAPTQETIAAFLARCDGGLHAVSDARRPGVFAAA